MSGVSLQRQTHMLVNPEVESDHMITGHPCCPSRVLPSHPRISPPIQDHLLPALIWHIFEGNAFILASADTCAKAPGTSKPFPCTWFGPPHLAQYPSALLLDLLTFAPTHPVPQLADLPRDSSQQGSELSKLGNGSFVTMGRGGETRVRVRPGQVVK